MVLQERCSRMPVETERDLIALALAMIGPTRTPKRPAGRAGQLCRAKAARRSSEETTVLPMKLTLPRV